MSLEIIRNDITKVSADAIVNTANPEVAVGYGVDSAIYDAAGKDRLLAEREKIGPMRPGDAAYTPAFDLDAKYIIHTVGPVWQGGDAGEKEILATCYRKALGIAGDLGCESVAFPLMSAGTYGFPKDAALKIAISEISDFLFNNEMEVFLVVYDKESFEVSGKAFNDIRSFIEEEDIREKQRLEKLHMRREMALEQAPKMFCSEVVLNAGIDEMIDHKDQTFQEYLFRIIDRKGLDDKEVYKKANIDRKHFSKIKSNVDYNPTKKTAVAFAIALGLNLDETKDLLLKAGIALTRSNIFDIIIEYCITHNIRDIYEINCILFDYDQPTLGL